MTSGNGAARCASAALAWLATIGAASAAPVELFHHGPQPSSVGQGIVVSVDFPVAGLPQPSGSVVIGDGTDSCIAELPIGSCLWVPRSAGSKTLTASYAGDVNFLPSMDSEPHVVEATGSAERVSLGPELLTWDPSGFIAGPRRVALSFDGRFVAFITSFALVPEDANFSADAYVLDRTSGQFELISVDTGGAQGDLTSDEVAISPDGRFVAFASNATNLVANDTNGVRDVFLRDRALATTVRVSVDTFGMQAAFASHEPDVSANGQRVVFKTLSNLSLSDTNIAGNHADVYVRDLGAPSTLLVSVNTMGSTSSANSYSPTISDDGSRVVFLSEALNLVASDTNGNTRDAFLRDLGGSTTELVGLSDFETQGGDPVDQASISPDGQHVLFRSASPLALPDSGFFLDCFVRHVAAGSTELASLRSDGGGGSTTAGVDVCAWGAPDQVWFLSLASDMTGDGDDLSSEDLFKRDLVSTNTTRITAGASHGVLPSTLAISDNGRHAAFGFANGTPVPGVLFDLALFDDSLDSFSGLKLDLRGNQSDQQVSIGFGAALSADGSLVAYVGQSPNLVPDQAPGRMDVMLRDRPNQASETISRGEFDQPANNSSRTPSMSADGRYVAFVSSASNLVPNDNGGNADIFVYDRFGESMQRITLAPNGADADNHSHLPQISPDGRYVVFFSQAGNLVAGDSNNRLDVFRWDRQQPVATAIERISVSDSEGQGTDDSTAPSMSADGDRIVFESDGAGLGGPGGTGSKVFLRVVSSGTTVQLSVGPGNTAANGAAGQPRISGDGRYVVFGTNATNIAPGLPGANRLLRLDLGNDSYDAVLGHDGSANMASPAYVSELSADGRYLSLITAWRIDPDDLDGDTDLVGYDFVDARGKAVNAPAGDDPQVIDTTSFALSADGSTMTAISESDSVVAGDSNGAPDQFAFVNPVYQLAFEQQVETLVPQANDGSQAPASDASGRFVVFQSNATNLGQADGNGASDIFRVDTETGAIVRLSVNDNGTALGAGSIEPSVSADGQAVLFVADDAGITVLRGESPRTTLKRAKQGGSWSVLMRNLLTGTTQRMAPGLPGGVGSEPQFAPGANALVYSAQNNDPMVGAPGQVEVFHLPLTRVGNELVAGAPRCLSCKSITASGVDGPQNSNGGSGLPTVSANGEWVAWQTSSTNVLENSPAPCPLADTAVMLRNLITGVAQRVSVPSVPGQCGPPGANSVQPQLDWSGRNLVFTSDQPLLPGDANAVSDAFVFDLDLNRLVRVSNAAGGDANGASTGATISGDGLQVAFESAATNLDSLTPDTNGFTDTHVASLTGGVLVGGAAAARRLSRTRAGEQANSHSQRPALNYNGTRIAFDSDAGNLAPGAQGGQLMIFQRTNPLNGDFLFGAGFE